MSASPQPPGLTSGPPCSAGGTGVLLNVDRVAEQLEELGYPAIQVRGLADSGWFLDNKQYRHTDCVDTITCAPTEAIRRGIRCPSGEGPSSCCSFAPEGPGWSGICGWGAPGDEAHGSLTCGCGSRYWNGVVPERCRRQFQEGEEWNCFFGYKVYPTLRCEWAAERSTQGSRGGHASLLLKIQRGLQSSGLGLETTALVQGGGRLCAREEAGCVPGGLVAAACLGLACPQH